MTARHIVTLAAAALSVLLASACSSPEGHSDTDADSPSDAAPADADTDQLDADTDADTDDGGDADVVMDADDSHAECGNGLIETGETCDRGTQDCLLSGEEGTQACNATCDGYNACISNALPANGSPYPMSPFIASITFDQSTLELAAPGSDQFGYTTASDGNIYVAWGDGGGFGGTNSLGRASLGVGRIEGTPPSWSPFNVWGGVDAESSQPPTLGKTSNGVIAVDGEIYLYVNEQDVWTNNHLWRSSDLGLTWSDLGQMFNEPGAAFNDPGVLQFGADYEGARDDYIYGFDESAFDDGLTMFRVERALIEDRTAYEFFAGLDASSSPIWSAEIADIARVFTDTNGTEWGVTATYHPVLGRYLLAVRHNGDSGEWGLFDAPEPWGPWTTVGYGQDFPEWTYTPDPEGASDDRPAYLHNFPTKWMSADGLTVWQISDRGDQFNIVRATLTLVGP